MIWTFCHEPVGQLYVFFGKMTIQIFCLFFDWLLVFVFWYWLIWAVYMFRVLTRWSSLYFSFCLRDRSKKILLQFILNCLCSQVGILLFQIIHLGLFVVVTIHLLIWLQWVLVEACRLFTAVRGLLPSCGIRAH